MNGFDYFIACYRNGLNLPVRIFHGLKSPANILRPNALSFINLGAEGASEEQIQLMHGLDVSIIAAELSDEVREFAKWVLRYRPKHLVILCRDRLMSWAGHRGWA